MYLSKYFMPSVLAASMATFSAGLAFAESQTTAVEKTADVPADVEFENGKVVFRAALDDSPLKFEFKPDQTLTPQVEEFYKTGVNPYSGDSEAIKAGNKSYQKLCQSCHLKDGGGRIGPSLNDNKWEGSRTHTEVGRFEIIYGGGAGAMQAFGRRVEQDDILKIMAFIDTLRPEK